MTTGQLLAQARRAKGLKQAALGALLGLDRFQIGRWELDRDGIPDSTRRRLEGLLELPEGGLVGDGVVEGVPRRRGRPVGALRYSLQEPEKIPYWIGYEALADLVRQYRGRMYERGRFAMMVQQGIIPSRIELGLRTAVPNVARRRFHWPAVRAAIDARMVVPALPLNVKSPAVVRRAQ